MYIEGRLEYTSNYYLPHLFFLSQIKTAAYIMQFFVHTIFCSFFFLFAWEKKEANSRRGWNFTCVCISTEAELKFHSNLSIGTCGHSGN